MKKLILISLALLGIFSFTHKSEAAYSFIRSLTVTSMASVASGTNINFPMLVSSTIASWASVGNGGKVQNLATAPNGGQEPADLIFATSADCAGTLNFETESYTSSTGALVDWVQVPTLSTGTVIYTCYGNTSVTTDQSRPSSTWNSNYKAVYHFPNGTILNASDSTANANFGTITSVTATSSGQIDGAGAYNGSALINVSSSATLDSTTTSWSFWFKTSSTAAAFPFIMGRAQTGGSFNGIVIFLDSTGKLRTQIYNNSATVVDFTGGAVLNTGGFHYGTLTISPSLATLYVDGVQVVSSTYTAWNFNSEVLRFGTSIDSFWGKWNGTIDESRISNVTLTPSWILTEYNNQNSPSTFYALGGEQTLAGSGEGPALFTIRAPLTIRRATFTVNN